MPRVAVAVDLGKDGKKDKNDKNDKNDKTGKSAPSTKPRPPHKNAKSRSGCQTCKIRRLKCDETRPECRHCVKKGVPCPGYPVILRWTTKYERVQKSTSSTVDPANFSRLASAVTDSIQPKSDQTAAKTTVPATSTSTSSSAPFASSSSSSSTIQIKRSDSPDRTELQPPWPASLSSSPPPNAHFSYFAINEAFTSEERAEQSELPPPLPPLPSLPPPPPLPIPTISSLPTRIGHNELDVQTSYIQDLGDEAEESNVIAAQDALCLPTYPIVHPPDEEQQDGLEHQQILFNTSRPHVSEPPLPLVPLPPLVPTGLVDVPTFLVDYWFQSVCSTWSAFDSHANPYRQLVSSLLTSSTAVFYAIQSMAAASLVEHMPRMRESALDIRRMAIGSLDHELRAFRSTSGVPGTADAGAFPHSLLISLFCLSSSICWMDTRQLGLHFLRQARMVLRTLNQRTDLLAPENRAILAFFNGCLTYEEMVRSVVTDNDNTDPYKTSRQQKAAVATAESPATISEATFSSSSSSASASASSNSSSLSMSTLSLPSSLQSSPLSISFHAWTGVSPDLLRLFGKTMLLCRSSRNRLRGNAELTEPTMLAVADDYCKAFDIEEVLLSIEIPNCMSSEDGDDDNDNDNGDCDNTDEEVLHLRAHLRDASEAFRLCSLHQLYQTFPDLLAKRLPGQTDSNGVVPHSQWLDPLALHITSILQRIPSTSRMRCLQPLLCLYAGTGLRLDTAVSQQTPSFASASFNPVNEMSNDENSSSNTTTSTTSANSNNNSNTAEDANAHLDNAEANVGTLPFSPSGLSPTIGYDADYPNHWVSPGSVASMHLSPANIEVYRARSFIRTRLGRLEELLPPKPITIAKQLLTAIWGQYDAETHYSQPTHWLDVMESTGLQCVFG